MGEFEDVIEALKERGDDDLAETLGKYTATSLRQKAAKSGDLERENESLKKELTSVKAVPKREAAFKAAGVDFDSLRPAELEIIRGLEHDGDEPSAEAVSQVIQQYGLPVSEVETEEVEQPAAGRIAAQARTATERKVQGNTTVTPEAAEEWTTEKILRFREKHPEEFEALKRGETVHGVAF